MKLLNIPLNSGSRDTEIVHTSIVFVANRFTGFLYRTRDQKTWVHLGDTGLGPIPAVSDMADGAHAFGVDPTVGFQRVQSNDVPMGDVSIISCY